MANYDRKEHLKAIHASRKATTSQKVDKAIQRLVEPMILSILIVWQARLA